MPNPSTENGYCRRYLYQREKSLKLKQTHPSAVTKLVLQNGTAVLCWEDLQTNVRAASIHGKHGWCKVVSNSMLRGF